MIRFGIVGAGTMGGRYAQVITHSNFTHRCQLVGVCDTDLQRAEAVAGPKRAAAYRSLAEMIKGSTPDAVYIATPDPAHRAPVVEAAAAGLHMLIEKPFATTVADAVGMAEAMKLAVQAGRLAFKAGRIPRKLHASAGSPLQGISR